MMFVVFEGIRSCSLRFEVSGYVVSYGKFKGE